MRPSGQQIAQEIFGPLSAICISIMVVCIIMTFYYRKKEDADERSVYGSGFALSGGLMVLVFLLANRDILASLGEKHCVDPDWAGHCHDPIDQVTPKMID